MLSVWTQIGQLSGQGLLGLRGPPHGAQQLGAESLEQPGAGGRLGGGWRWN